MTALAFEQARLDAGKKLLVFAWITEIFACAIGLAITFMVLIETNQAISANSQTNVSLFSPSSLLAALPFLMVSVVELTKIPMATAFYHSKRLLWRSVFLGSLIFIACVTFESVFNGFERNFARTTLVVDQYKRELTGLDEAIDEKKRRISELNSITLDSIETQYSTRREVLSSEYQQRTDAIREKSQQVRASVSKSQLESLEQLRQQYLDQINAYEGERKAEIERVEAQYKQRAASTNNETDTKRTDLRNQLDNELNKLEKLESGQTQELAESNILWEPVVKKRWDKRIAPVQQRINTLRQQLNNTSSLQVSDELSRWVQSQTDAINKRYEAKKIQPRKELVAINSDISQITASQDEDTKRQLQVLEAEQKDLGEQYGVQMKQNEAERDRLMATYKERQESIASIESELVPLNEQALVLRSNINDKVADQQVYRVAKSFYNKDSAADLDPKQVATVATVWFGSLAFIVSFTGIILALASLTLRFGHLKDDHEHHPLARKTLYSLRRLFVALSKRATNPKIVTEVITKEVEVEVIKEVPVEVVKQVPIEIVKEVPVEKVHIKEVPVEIIKRELVHVPLYTNDPHMLSVDRGEVVRV
ncbi:hypothetical protein [Kistimonas asteriae]|uniref:hypothetical protein n=1 Tax=Kistimonas asteriae TaxID=517724 RepID=UPI001BA9FFCF|nr:hypothetical protein [Kistimonas asteriae]